jgi:hypothetical protein
MPRNDTPKAQAIAAVLASQCIVGVALIILFTLYAAFM